MRQNVDKKKTYLSHRVTKPTKWHVPSVKTQISLGIRPVWSESSLSAQWVAKDPSFPHADSEDSDQTGHRHMPRLIWVLAGRTATLLVLSRGGSNVEKKIAICWYVTPNPIIKNSNIEINGTNKKVIFIPGAWHLVENQFTDTIFCLL